MLRHTIPSSRPLSPPGPDRRKDTLIVSGRPSRRTPLLIVAAFFLILALLSPPERLAAQGLVANPSFEDIVLARLPSPGWGPGPSTPTEVAISTIPPLFGCNEWYTRLSSPDIFWGPTHVPNNYMTAPRSPLPAFHGNNYAGISTGRVGGVFRTEVLAGTLTTSPWTGTIYEFHGRFAMGTARNLPGRVRISLVGPTSSVLIGELTVSSPKWTLFSQYVIPPAGTYDRIQFEGVDLGPSAQQAYIFIDSVDLVPSRPFCSYLGARLSKIQSPAGQCCYDLIIDNTLPLLLGSVYSVRVSTTSPVTITGPVAGPGWTLGPPPPAPTQVMWSSATPGSPIPTGAALNAGRYCIIPNGVSPQRHIIEFLGPNYQVFCRDTIYTNCDEPTLPCMDMYGPWIQCDSADTSGNARYKILFWVNPVAVSFPPGSSIHLRTADGTITPSVFPLGVGTTLVGPIMFTDLPPTNTQVCLIGELHVTVGEKDSVVCLDTLCAPLPDCPKECCANFTKQIQNWSITAVNGNVKFKACVLAGPAQIKRFSATIVSAQTRTRCASGSLSWTSLWYRSFGDIVGGTLGGSLGSPLPGPFYSGVGYSREIVWGGSGSPVCATFNPCVPLTLDMIFPDPPTDPNCIDSLSITIRYSFTDCNCLTCDTVITYTGARKYIKLPTKTWPGDPGTPGTTGGPGHPLAMADPGLMRIEMSSDENGQLSVTLPASDPEATAIRFTGISLRPLGVALASMAEHGSQESAEITGNMASMGISLDGGQSAVFDLSYLNSQETPVIGNYVRFKYEIVGDEEHTEYETDDILVEAHTPGASGGDDVVEESAPQAQDVRTYVLHIDADNSAGESVHALRIHVNGSGTQLIAVGPVGDGTDATLTAGTDGNDNSVVQVDKSTWEVQSLRAGETLTPIYLTFAGAANGATVDYETINDNGSVLTSNSVTLGSALRTAGVGSDVAGPETSLWPVYPNPSGSSATVGFRMQSSGKVILSVRDMQGREVLRKVDGERFGAGDHLVPMATASLAPGTYVVMLEVDGQTYTRTMTVVR